MDSTETPKVIENPIVHIKRGKAYPPGTEDRAYELFEAHKKHQEISLILKVPKTTIQTWSKRGSWQSRRANKEAKSIARKLDKLVEGRSGKLAALDEAEIERFGYSVAEMTEPTQQARFEKVMRVQALKWVYALSKLPVALVLQQADKWEKLDKLARKALHLEDAKPAPIINLAFLASNAMPDRSEPKLLPADSVPLLQAPDAPAE